MITFAVHSRVCIAQAAQCVSFVVYSSLAPAVPERDGKKAIIKWKEKEEEEEEEKELVSATNYALNRLHPTDPLTLFLRS